jgi:hypothetical protein
MVAPMFCERVGAVIQLSTRSGGLHWMALQMDDASILLRAHGFAQVAN